MVVAVGGYYGFRNAGDEAILSAIVSEARRRGHEVTVLSADPGRTVRDHGVRAVHRYRPQDVVRAIAGSELFALGGGGLLQDRTSRRSLLYYLSLVRLARAMARPAVAFNVSLGPLSRLGRRLVRGGLRGVGLVVRDRRSLALARELGLSPELGADPALLLTPPTTQREPNLVVLIPRHGVDPRPLAAAGRALAGLGYEVLALALQPGRDDEALAEFSGLNREATSDPRRVLYLAASAGYVVSARLHGMILAAAAGTPFAGVDYDPKVAAFAEETRSPLLPLSPDPGEVVRVVSEGVRPDWPAVARLKERARDSFDRLLATPAPAGGP